MPVEGLPIILDTTLNTLLQGSTISSFKIFHNLDESSTIVMKFAGHSHLARSPSTYPPRPQLATGQLRGHELSAVPKKHNKQSVEVCNKSVRVQSTNISSASSSHGCPPSSTCAFAAPDVVCCDTPKLKARLPIRQEHTTSTPHHGTSDLPNVQSPSPVSKVSNNDGDVLTMNFPTHTVSPTSPSNLHLQSSNDIYLIHTDKRPEESGVEDNGCFHSEVYAQKAEKWRDALSEEMEDRLFDCRRNRSYVRVATQPQSTNEEDTVLEIETDDLVFSFYPNLGTIGDIHVFEEDDISNMSGKDKVTYEQFLQLPELELDSSTPQHLAINTAIANLVDFLRNMKPI